MTSELKYIYSDRGDKEAIILPISFWNQIKSQLGLQEDQEMVHPELSFASLQGMLEGIPVDILVATGKMRDEWERNI